MKIKKLPWRQEIEKQIDLLWKRVHELTRARIGADADSGAATLAMEKRMSDLRAEIDVLTTKVADQATVIEGVTTTLNGLRDQLTNVAGDLDAAGELDAAAKLTDLAAAIDANTKKLALAVAKGTEADDEVHASSM